MINLVPALFTFVSVMLVFFNHVQSTSVLHVYPAELALEASKISVMMAVMMLYCWPSLTLQSWSFSAFAVSCFIRKKFDCW